MTGGAQYGPCGPCFTERWALPLAPNTVHCTVSTWRKVRCWLLLPQQGCLGSWRSAEIQKGRGIAGGAGFFGSGSDTVACVFGGSAVTDVVHAIHCKEKVAEGVSFPLGVLVDCPRTGRAIGCSVSLVMKLGGAPPARCFW